jgi:hypothetical protein
MGKREGVRLSAPAAHRIRRRPTRKAPEPTQTSECGYSGERTLAQSEVLSLALRLLPRQDGLTNLLPRWCHV